MLTHKYLWPGFGIHGAGSLHVDSTALVLGNRKAKHQAHFAVPTGFRYLVAACIETRSELAGFMMVMTLIVPLERSRFAKQWRQLDAAFRDVSCTNEPTTTYVYRTNYMFMVIVQK